MLVRWFMAVVDKLFILSPTMYSKPEATSPSSNNAILLALSMPLSAKTSIRSML